MSDRLAILVVSATFEIPVPPDTPLEGLDAPRTLASALKTGQAAITGAKAERVIAVIEATAETSSTAPLAVAV